jgi:sulfate adenylyltransferase subunit 2
MFAQELENEAIYIMREVAAQFERPIILFSGGKDSLSLIHLAHKAFWPAPIPFKVLHIDTGHNFKETIAFRDQVVAEYNLDLVVGSVQASIDRGTAKEEVGINASRNALQTVTLLESIAELRADACIGGARRDEEKARAKERIFSVRKAGGGWNAVAQRPELWNLYNGHLDMDQNMRVFPLSNWTEEDVWQYILREKIAVPSIYFAHERKVFYREGVLMPFSDFITMNGEEVHLETVRFRTVGDMTCTAAIKSRAQSVAEIIEEISSSNTSERGARLDDQRSQSAMEDRKNQGYF